MMIYTMFANQKVIVDLMIVKCYRYPLLTQFHIFIMKFALNALTTMIDQSVFLNFHWPK
jgi:hypothetical protein